MSSRQQHIALKCCIRYMCVYCVCCTQRRENGQALCTLVIQNRLRKLHAQYTWCKFHHKHGWHIHIIRRFKCSCHPYLRISLTQVFYVCMSIAVQWITCFTHFQCNLTLAQQINVLLYLQQGFVITYHS